ncbi:voltage gated chloride channel [Nitzschia inconspicua]|uniref:Voltage gated chloride channel n=1 Tax=Nitzschia inconspicua TaxID=303405 RepID=A0A9K3L6D5_9STRA|nr:voltage gated chloride channel [Nitzschia inconspicua]
MEAFLSSFNLSSRSTGKEQVNSNTTFSSSLRRRVRLKKRRKMEGIRLRSDSDGSVKNAFYQGTIVSDAVQASEGGFRSRPKRNVTLEASTRSNLSTVKGDYNRIPPLPRRSIRRTTSSGSNKILSQTFSPEIGSIEGEDDSFEFGPQISDVRDSLRYSSRSMFSDTTRQTALSGTSLLNEDNVNSPRNSPLGMPISSANHLMELEKTTEVVPDPVIYDGVDDDPDFTRESVQRFSFVSTSSGIYFNQPTPPGPLQPGMVYGSIEQRIPSSFSLLSPLPVQQQNNSAFGAPKERKVPPFLKAPEPTIEEDENEDSVLSEDSILQSERIMDWIDFSAWLSEDIPVNEHGLPDQSIQWTIRGIIRFVFYNPVFPEFSTLQQFTWAVIIGAFMGVYTAGWKLFIEACVQFTWKTVPEKLLGWGIFTDLDGGFPLFHYMWIVPTLFGGILSYIITAMKTPIPTQDDWIHTLHSRGVEESDTFVPLFLVATAGMASGLSLGPELPLVLTAGMIGSWMGVLFHQSMIQARILNLTAASAAIGGFFGFPIAGALFVLELPHRMGLQYFEALNSATIASIVAVLINRIVMDSDVTGMFQYPFLNESLPSYIFKDTIVYGLFGGALGILYTLCIKSLKSSFHHLLDGCSSSKQFEPNVDLDTTAETTPLIGGIVEPADFSTRKSHLQEKRSTFCRIFSGLIPHKPTRAGFTGMLAGFVVGITGIFLPHVMFWGEAQLQTMIDKGRTPLPVFGKDDEPTSTLVALGRCMVDDTEDTGFGIGCSVAIIFAKIFVTGISMGTGIVGGHFWAPLFVGCVASHFFMDVMQLIAAQFEGSFSLAQYPCVAMLCIMGSVHVVTFRAHIAIILILTLTIDAFVPKESSVEKLKVAGDYSAVFPLLTVAVFVALQISRHAVFYKMQRSRGDINAVPQALCEPGKEGKPLVIDYEGNRHELDEDIYDFDDSETEDWSDPFFDRIATNNISQDDIEANFQAKNGQGVKAILKMDSKNVSCRDSLREPSLSDAMLEPLYDLGNFSRPVTPNPEESRKKSLKTLDELLNDPIRWSTSSNGKKKTHRRTQSEPFLMDEANQRMAILSTASPPASTPVKRPTLKRLDSYGEINQYNPSLMDQVRGRAASFDKRLPR